VLHGYNFSTFISSLSNTFPYIDKSVVGTGTFVKLNKFSPPFLFNNNKNELAIPELSGVANEMKS